MRLWGAALSILVGMAALPATAQNYNQVNVFGDSTVDTGWFAVLTRDTPPLGAPGNVAGGTGNASFDAIERLAVSLGGNAHSTGPGPGNAQILAAFFGLTANPQNAGGTNYAISGATDSINFGVTNIEELAGFTNIGQLPSTVQQIGNYLQGVGFHANPNALYSFSTGGNDVFIGTFAVGSGASITAVEGILSAEASDLANAISTLQRSGARYIIVSNEYATASTTSTQNTLGAFLLGNSNPAAGPVTAGATWSDLRADGVNFIPADTQSLIRAVESTIGTSNIFGITTTSNACQLGSNITALGPTGYGAVCVNATAGQLITAGLGAAVANVGTLVSPDALQTHLFMDGVHLTAAGQQIWADYEYSLVTAPSTISFLAENAVKTRLSLVSSIQNQIDVSESHRGPGGINAWVGGDITSISMDNYHGFPNDPGTVWNGSAGVDFRLAPGLIGGVAVSTSSITSSLGQYGNFKQQENTVSLYAAYDYGPVWGNVIGTFGNLNYTTNRVVPLGITFQSNTGSTSGNDWSAAFLGGYKFWNEGFTHGPVVGFVYQNANVGGFSESNGLGVTNLSFASQTRDSDVGQFGYRVSYDWGGVQPFAQVTWNHEFADTNRNVTASLLSDPAAPSFSLPAVLLGKDWGEIKGGYTWDVGGGAKLLAVGSADFAQNSATVYGVSIGLNIAF